MITEEQLNQFCENIANCPYCEKEVDKFYDFNNKIEYIYCGNCFIRLYNKYLPSLKGKNIIFYFGNLFFQYNFDKKIIRFTVRDNKDIIEVKKEFITIQDLITFCLNRSTTIKLLK